MVASLEETFSRNGSFDRDVIDSVPLRSTKPWLDNKFLFLFLFLFRIIFTSYEIKAALRKLANGKSGGEAQCPVEYYKALKEDQGTVGYLHEVTNSYWESGIFPTGEIPSGPPPDLAEPTMGLAIKNSWSIVFNN